MIKSGLLTVMILYTIVTDGQKMNIEVNTKAKAYSTDSIEINAPVEKVFSLVSDINNWPKWFEGVTEVKVNGNITEGTNFTWKAKGYKIKSKIHTLKPDTAIGWTGKIWWINAVHNWRFKNLKNGKTLVTIQENFSGLGSSFMKNSLKKDMKNDLIVLKRAAE